MPPLKGSCRNTAMPFGMEKLKWLGYQCWKKFEDTFIRFDRMYEREEWTDRHRMMAKAMLDIASRGKNDWTC